MVLVTVVVKARADSWMQCCRIQWDMVVEMRMVEIMEAGRIHLSFRNPHSLLMVNLNSVGFYFHQVNFVSIYLVGCRFGVEVERRSEGLSLIHI